MHYVAFTGNIQLDSITWQLQACRYKVFQITFCFPNPNNFSPSKNIVGTSHTPQIVVSMTKIHLWHHKLWCQWQKFTFDTTNCGVNGKSSLSTPQNVVSKVNFRRHALQKITFDTTFVVSKVNFCHWHHNLWCQSWNFSCAPVERGLKLWGFGKQKVMWNTFVVQ